MNFNKTYLKMKIVPKYAHTKECKGIPVSGRGGPEV
jgi:hypothetical protein